MKVEARGFLEIIVQEGITLHLRIK